ncbi:6208_t:CDS:10 [Diversispora eburnea]|uniref:phosphoinositide 5-phosphatase n=1 Tax=Diversispora eburnea TaxID=1213867 RepID=A0A9N8V3B6_9GLOM|nr:6208_t:CDS:10 [Diversispora eburnea]
MQGYIYCRDKPRSIILRPISSSEKYNQLILSFKQITQNSDSRPKCNVRLLPESEIKLEEYRKLNQKPIFGCLGLLQLGDVVTKCHSIGEIRPQESVYRILNVEFYSLVNSSWDSLPSNSNNRTNFDENELQNNYIHPCYQLRKLLSNGHFYFSSDFDLTKTLSSRIKSNSSDKNTFDDHFLWNRFWIEELLKFRLNLDKEKQIEMDNSGFLDALICSNRASISVISKLSCKRAGTRYNTRGIDDDGNVANFTETILQMPSACYSYIQVRGSVPVVSHRIQLSRGAAATQPAVERHFNELKKRYGNVHIINLLGAKEGEFLLSDEYRNRIKSLNEKIGNIEKKIEKKIEIYNNEDNEVKISEFDFNGICKNGNYENANILIHDIRELLESSAFLVVDSATNTPICYQKGVFRTNYMYLMQIEINPYDIGNLYSRHSYLWAENGDSLSKIYAGTGALKSEYTRSGKLTWTGVLNDATKSMNRFYINNFQDKSKQEVIDLLLGKLMNSRKIEIHDPVNEMVRSDMKKRLNEFSEKSMINIFTGTYNLNGKLPCESLTPWLWAFSDQIVELKPQQIVYADPEKLNIWEDEINKTLNFIDHYVIIRSDQLVGTALVIYARADIVSNIRNVEYVMKKTGLGGMAGNKGAVAIRLDYDDTSICFVTAHLAAGQSNWADRNRDYRTINDGIIFKNGRNLNHHDNEQVRELIEMENFERLLNADQLTHEIAHGNAFTEYIEGPITFFPTYKYDDNSDNYDSSEKQRIPSWTDRILYRGNGTNKIRQIGYTRAELKISDHKPVMSSFDLETIKFDKKIKDKIKRELYFEKLKLVSKSNYNQDKITTKTIKDPTKNWNKVATNVRKVNNPLLPSHNYGLDDSKNNDKSKNFKNVAMKAVENTGPPVGILIDLNENNKSDELSKQFKGNSNNEELPLNIEISSSLPPLPPHNENIFLEDDDAFLSKAPSFTTTTTKQNEIKQGSKIPPIIKPKPKVIKRSSSQGLQDSQEEIKDNQNNCITIMSLEEFFKKPINNKEDATNISQKHKVNSSIINAATGFAFNKNQDTSHTSNLGDKSSVLSPRAFGSLRGNVRTLNDSPDQSDSSGSSSDETESSDSSVARVEQAKSKASSTIGSNVNLKNKSVDKNIQETNIDAAPKKARAKVSANMIISDFSDVGPQRHNDDSESFLNKYDSRSEVSRSKETTRQRRTNNIFNDSPRKVSFDANADPTFKPEIGYSRSDIRSDVSWGSDPVSNRQDDSYYNNNNKYQSNPRYINKLSSDAPRTWSEVTYRPQDARTDISYRSDPGFSGQPNRRTTASYMTERVPASIDENNLFFSNSHSSSPHEKAKHKPRVSMGAMMDVSNELMSLSSDPKIQRKVSSQLILIIISNKSLITLNSSLDATIKEQALKLANLPSFESIVSTQQQQLDHILKVEKLMDVLSNKMSEQETEIKTLKDKLCEVA